MPKQPAYSPRVVECLNRLRSEPTICGDVETSGLDWRKNHIVGYVWTFGPKPNDTYYLPVRHAGGGNIPGCSVPLEADSWKGDAHPLETEMADILAKRTAPVHYFGHNFAFDLKFYAKHGIHLVRTPNCTFEDTQHNGAIIYEYEPSFSLDALARGASVQAKKGDELYTYIARVADCPADRKSMAHYWRTPGDEPIVVDYASGDGTTTWQLRDKQRIAISTPGEDGGTLDLVHNIECRLIPILHRMTWRGIRIDENRLDEIAAICADRRDALMGKYFDGFNPLSPSHVQKVLTDSGVTHFPRTAPSKARPEGSPSFTEKFLETTEAGQGILKVRKYNNLLNTFILPMRDRHMYKGRVHTTFNQLRSDEMGTLTGRLSSSDPNLQQVPKRNKELGPLFRSIFIPDEGRIMASVDYSQCEPRLLAYYGRVRILLEGYRAPETVDAHTRVAQAASIDRDDGKRLNQALLTGAGRTKVTSMLGKPMDVAGKIVDDYFAAMPEIPVIQSAATRRMRSRGYVVSLLGRRARPRPGKEYVGLNRLLQCGNADIIKLKMVECQEHIDANAPEDVDLLNNIHDDLMYQFTPAGRKVYEECLEIMANFGADDVIQLDLPVEVEAGEGVNWSESSYGKDRRVIRGAHMPPRELEKKEAA